MEPDQIREQVPIFRGPTDLDAIDRSPGTQRRKWPRHGLSLPLTPWAVTGGRSTFSRIRGWSSQLRNVKSDVSGTGPTPTGYRDTAGEANTFTLGLPVPILRSPIPGDRDIFEV